MGAYYNSFSIFIIRLKKSLQTGLASIFHHLKDFPVEKGLNFSLWTGFWMLNRGPSSRIHPQPGCWPDFPHDSLQSGPFHEQPFPGAPFPGAYCLCAQPFAAWLWPLKTSHCLQALSSSGLSALNHPDTELCPLSQADALSTALPTLPSRLGSKSSSMRFKYREYTVCAWACLLGFCFPQ